MQQQHAEPRGAPRWQQHGGGAFASQPQRATTPVAQRAEPGVVPAGARTDILRGVDDFVMSLPLGTGPGARALLSAAADPVVHAHVAVHRMAPFTPHPTPPSSPLHTGDAAIEEAVATRLYAAELGRAEAQAKLDEWSKVASELRGVVEAQAAQAQAARSQQQQGRREPAGAASARPHITQLQRLVQDMRSELLQAPAAEQSQAAAMSPPSAAGWASTDAGSPPAGSWQAQEREAAMAEELADTQQRLRQLQAAHDSLLAQQAAQQDSGVEARALQLQLEHARREAEGARTEKERLRRALIDAEIELQRKANDVAAAQQQQAVATQAAAQRQEEQLMAAAAQLAAAQADAASLRQQLATAQAAAEEAGGSAEARRGEAQAAADHAAAATAAAAAAATSERQRREAAEAQLAQLQSQVAQLQAAAVDAGSSAAADMALLQNQLEVSTRRERQAAGELAAAREQLAAVKQAHGEALNAAQARQQQLAAAQVGRGGGLGDWVEAWLASSLCGRLCSA